MGRLKSLEFVKAWRWGAKWEHMDICVVAHTGHVPFSLRDALCQVIELLGVVCVYGQSGLCVPDRKDVQVPVVLWEWGAGIISEWDISVLKVLR